MWTCHLQTFRSLAAPKKPSEVTLKELWELAAAHFHPQPSLAVQRFRFNSRTRQAGESVAAYLAELKKLSEHCDFGDSLNDMLRDRIVCGIQDQRTQRRLLAETDLTFKRAFEEAQAIDSADKQVYELQYSRKADVHAVGPHFDNAETRYRSVLRPRAHQRRRLIATQRSPTRPAPHRPPTARYAPLRIASLHSIMPLRSRGRRAHDETECIGRPSALSTIRRAMPVASEAT